MGAVLVTGGYGFLGSYISRKMVKSNREVIILDITDNDSLLLDVSDKIVYEKCNLTEWGRLKEIFNKYCITDVCHIAAMVSPLAEEDLIRTFENNVRGTLNLLETSKDFGVSSFFFGSSTGVYGDSLPGGNVVEEDTPQFPWHMYGTTKVCCERLGVQYFRKYGLNFRGLRFSPIFGLERRAKGPTGFCDGMIREVLSGNSYSINIEPDTPIVSAISGQDAASAIIGLMNADEKRLTRRIYNIDAMSFTAQELVDEVRKCIPGAQISFDPDTEISDNLRKWPVPCNRRARDDWDWMPKHCDVGSYVRSVITEYELKRGRGIKS